MVNLLGNTYSIDTIKRIAFSRYFFYQGDVVVGCCGYWPIVLITQVTWPHKQ